MARKVASRTPIESESLRIGKPGKVAAGLKGVQKSFAIGIAEAGLARTWKTMRTVNRFDGYDCPGCAWPDPADHRSGFEFCENGAKAFATEATKKRVTPAFFAKHDVHALAAQSDMWQDKQGRLTTPMFLDAGADHYKPISWEDAFGMIAAEVEALSSPDEAVLYTSGRASNEAAFLWGTLARQIGTNNLPDCSNMCHESSGVGLSGSIGIGKGTVRLSCFEKADLVLVIGQNPGTNHPRMLSALAETRRAGGSVVSINPLMETGLNRFKHPQEVIRLMGKGTAIADDHYPVSIGGDQALLQGVAKVVLASDTVDAGFIEAHTEGYEAWRTHIEAADWDEIVMQSGIPKERIEKLGRAVAASKSMIICWAMGVTQHVNAVATIQEITNLLLAGGHFARPGAGACPVRGHSNVQGDRTVGINHHPSSAFLDAFEASTGIEAPRSGGYDTVEFCRAAAEGKVRLFMALGGNLVSAMSDTEAVAEAIEKIPLTVQISTKLNRSHLVTGQRALILPCLGRTEKDPAGFVSVENSMGVVHSSTGSLPPASADLRSEPAIIAGIGAACFPSGPFDWGAHGVDHDVTRTLIEATIPGFENYNARVRRKGGFELPNGPRDGPTWNTPSGKAIFHAHPLPDRALEADRFVLMTMRSHDQYNTTIYGMDDRYRGVYGARRVLFMHPADMAALDLAPQAEVDITSHWGPKQIHAPSWKVVPYQIPRGNLGAYFPEANVLVPLDSVALGSNTPTSKWVEVTVRASKG